MDDLVDGVSIISSLLSLFLIPITVLSILYFIKRNGFYVSVNCWFCNDWTKVLYTDRNSFYCPFCLQYNGFSDDGGYNKVIEAQFDTSFNKHESKTNEKTESLSNGLCTYCNNNQQLKVRQLANFVPLNEKNYDVEVEHFRTQLEKSYKLCKKCDKILKKTIEKQHAWIFGNRIKNFHNKGLHLLNSNKSNTFSLFKKSILGIIRFCLILCLLIILCQALNAKINYSKTTSKEYFSDIFVPYTVLLNDWCHLVSSSVNNFIRSMSNKLKSHHLSVFKNARIMNNDILPLTWIGLTLEIILLIWSPKSFLWKANELLGWIILIATALNTFHDDYFIYINALQIFSCVAIICGLLITSDHKGEKLLRKKKFVFKKIKATTFDADSSDEEVFEITSGSSFSSKKSSKACSNSLGCRSHSQNFLFQDVLRNTTNLNNTSTTARSTKSSSVFNTPLRNNSTGNELHQSLDNLHLSNLSYKPQPCTSPVFSVNSVNRPILSPPKLKNITQNSWTAGGFWKNDVTAFPVTTECASLSRSSSQSSGFVSNNDPVVPNTYNSLPPSREASLHGDFEKTSILSEPPYHFKPINSSNTTMQSSHNFPFSGSQIQKQSSPKACQLYYRTENNMFYPVLGQNSMLLIQGNNIPRFNFESSFSNLSLKGLNTNNRFSPPIFGEKPIISSLFKNLQGLGSQPCTFKTPQC